MQHNHDHETTVDWSLVTMGVVMVLAAAYLLAHLA